MWRLEPLQRSLWDLYNWLVVLVAINILWFLLSLTIIAFPAATAALFGVALEVEGGHSPGVREYLESTRRWLFKAWAWGLLIIALVIVTGVALPFYAAQTGLLWLILFVLSALVAAFAWAVAFYFWPYLLLQDRPLMWRALRNAALTVAAAPLYVLLYAGLSLLFVAVSLLYLVPIPVITPVVVAFFGAYSLKIWLVRRGLVTGRPDAHADSGYISDHESLG